MVGQIVLLFFIKGLFIIVMRCALGVRVWFKRFACVAIWLLSQNMFTNYWIRAQFCHPWFIKIFLEDTKVLQ